MKNDSLIINNPLTEPFQTPHATVPFHLIKTADFEPAIEEGIKLHNIQISSITDNENEPTFENTIEALENSGELLDRITSIFGNLLNTNADEELQTLASSIIPILSEHNNNIGLNLQLFNKIKAVYDRKDELPLNKEQSKLLEDTYTGFVRRGANLEGADKENYRKLSNELSQLELQFEQNCLKNNNEFQLSIEDKTKLTGLPENVLEAAQETAKEKGQTGYAFTLKAPSYIAFMRYADDRELRRQMYMAYNTQGIKDNGSNNIEIVKEIVNHRMQIAQLLDYKDFASYVLKKRMAEDETHVYALFKELLNAYMPTAHKEIKELTEFVQEWQGDADFALMPWDVSYYSNKLKEKMFHIDAELLRPYFELDKVKAGIFGLASRLYGIKFERNTEIPVYQKEVEVYEVFDADESFLGVLYLDFFPRDGKQSGAWTSSFTDQWIDRKTGEDHRPQILISTNFNKPTATKPALLTFEEMRTFLHEFGHSLHGMLSKVTYQSQSGTSVYWDFVELPSQFMENYAIEKDFLHTFAKHYETGEAIPNEYVQHIVDADNFNVAYACLRQVGFGLIDMAWYTRKTIFEGDVIKFEKEAEKEVLLMPDAENTCMSTQFSHIFCGGYAAGYYSYKWAEVIETDAFSLFQQKGIFDSATAQSFRDNILSKGGTEEPMLLYKRFRGQEPSIDALLIKDGIKSK